MMGEGSLRTGAKGGDGAAGASAGIIPRCVIDLFALAPAGLRRAHINKSLLALANCINALTDPSAPKPKFRDSKLTLLIKTALESSDAAPPPSRRAGPADGAASAMASKLAAKHATVAAKLAVAEAPPLRRRGAAAAGAARALESPEAAPWAAPADALLPSSRRRPRSPRPPSAAAEARRRAPPVRRRQEAPPTVAEAPAPPTAADALSVEERRYAAASPAAAAPPAVATPRAPADRRRCCRCRRQPRHAAAAFDISPPPPPRAVVASPTLAGGGARAPPAAATRPLAAAGRFSGLRAAAGAGAPPPAVAAAAPPPADLVARLADAEARADRWQTMARDAKETATPGGLPRRRRAGATTSARSGNPLGARRPQKFVFDDDANDGCACVLGYRPCEATEPIVAFALRTRTPFMLLPCCAHRVGDEQPDSCGRMLDLLRDRDPATIKKGKLPGSDTYVLYATFRDDAE
ncbi:hypothetical protein SO694_00130070 [Aureococcus anophagefferens]|uniref:Kinesin motor domain-containing protein n=1 Tax=Aureococcus anophagefferens TaxID=44056 RepID=A0ABR1GG08_AURAN